MNNSKVELPTQPTLNKGGVVGSVLVEYGNYSVGDFFNGFPIKEVHKLELSINYLGVITWHLYDSKNNHRVTWINGSIKEVKNYHLCSTAYYPETKFSEWGKCTHKSTEYRIAESLGFESPRAMGDYLILTYKSGFNGQLLSFGVMDF